MISELMLGIFSDLVKGGAITGINRINQENFESIFNKVLDEFEVIYFGFSKTDFKNFIESSEFESQLELHMNDRELDFEYLGKILAEYINVEKSSSTETIIQEFFDKLEINLIEVPKLRDLLLLKYLKSAKDDHNVQTVKLNELLQKTDKILDFSFTLEALNLSSRPYHVPLQKPPPVHHFVGRSNELKALIDNMRPGHPITLCGPAGIGKTALVAEAIWRLAPNNDPPERFPDGIIFHTFQDRPLASLALETIARSYGEEADPSPADAARRALQGRNALIILDGAESADDLRPVLAVTGNCCVIITSQRHSDAPADYTGLLPMQLDEALELLQAWGQRYAADRTSSTEICKLLGGLPFAISIAGRYMAQRQQYAIDYLAWLKETPLDALDLGKNQYESIRILIEHSLDQLDEMAYAALGVIGVLSSESFNSDLIAIALENKQLEANRCLGELVNYGLLLRPDSHYQVTHTLVHMFARKLLTPTSEILVRLARYYNAFAREQTDLGLSGCVRLDAHRSHIMMLQAACLAAGEWSVVQNLTWAIKDYLKLQGHWTESVVLIDAGLVAAGSDCNRYNIAAFLNLKGSALARLGDIRKAIDFHEEASAIFKEIGNRQGQAATLAALGRAYAKLSETRKAVEYYEEALAISKEIGNHQGQAATLAALGRAYAKLGETRKAIDYYEEALAISKEIDDSQGQAATLAALGRAYAKLGETREAIDCYEEALAISKEIGDRKGQAADLAALGKAYAKLGKKTRAIDYYEEALAISKEIGDRQGQAADLAALGRAYAASKNMRTTMRRKSIDYYEKALAISEEIGDRQEQAATLAALGRTYDKLGETRKAIDYYEEALAISQEIGNRQGQAATLSALGQAYFKLRETCKAIDYHEKALAISKEIGDNQEQAANLSALGLTYDKLGETRKATDYYEEALAISKEIDDRNSERANLGNLGRAYNELGETLKAIDCYKDVLVIYREIHDLVGEKSVLEILGSNHTKLGDIDKGMEYFNQALTIARAVGDQLGERNVFENLGNVYVDLGNTDEAIEFYGQALKIDREIGHYNGECTILSNLSNAYQVLGNLSKAIESSEQALVLSHKINNKKNKATAILNASLVLIKIGEGIHRVD